ncbi:MAG: methyltransferase domain-containing protein [Pseudomonadota bacterium]
MKYQAKIVLSNKNNAHTIAFDRIKEISAGRKLNILEVGCSTGYFGSALIDHGHQVWGVEPSPLAAEEARKHLTFVYVGNIEGFFESNPTAKFDVIVFGDVLEHLAAPDAVLVTSRIFLNHGGVIVASVPNVAHTAIRAMLLEGRWDYVDLGIMDRTHLRFYTRDSLVDLFSESAYLVKSVDAVCVSAEAVDELCAMNLKTESIALARNSAKDNRGYDFQYIVVAEPCQSNIPCHEANIPIRTDAGLRVLCLVHATESSIVDIRIRTPLKQWAKRHSGAARVVSIFEHTVADLQWADVIIFQRDAGEYIVSLARQLQAQGKKIVFEIDDFLLELPTFLAHHEPAISRSRPYILEVIGMADALSVSTRILGDQLDCYNKKRHLTPNYSQANVIHARHFDCSPECVTLVVASSDRVVVDMLVEPLRLLQQKHACRVIGIGPPGQYLASHGVEVQQYDNMSYADFCRFLSSLANAIGVIPLDSSLFSSCKSPVKFFDYSMAGLPSVCSNVLPYSDVIKDGENGYLVDNETSRWTETLEALIVQSGARLKISENARVFVAKNHNLNLAADAWAGLFESLNIDLSKIRNHQTSFVTDAISIKRVSAHLFRHLVRPTSYIKAMSTLKRHGIKGLYEKLRRR